ncbi:MAG TPA: DUF1822 family protein [Coleofasciculaceae cyanobacterium]|jgi:hypothetical protein
MNNSTAPLTFTAPISPLARQRAEQLFKQQATPEKGEQVRLNILAVCFVNSYLQGMGFETDLEASDSWNPIQQIFLDVADLNVKNLGKLECRPVLEETQVIYIPPEVESNRIGYLAVQINQSFREATLLGFVKKVSSEQFPISQLESLERFHEYLEYLSHIKQAELASPSFAPSKTWVKLEQWFETIFESGWQEIEALLGTQRANLALTIRSPAKVSVERGKLINLGMQYQSQKVILVVALTPENDKEIDITVEVHPKRGQTYLPPNLHVMVLDNLGESVMEATARSKNSHIQLQFSGEPRERFSVKVTLDDVSVIENFVI